MQGLSRPRQKALVVFRRVKDARAFIVEEHPAKKYWRLDLLDPNVELDRSSLEEVNQNVLIDNGHYREGTTRSVGRLRGAYHRIFPLQQLLQAALIKTSQYMRTALAREFGVTRAAICHIKKNRFEALLLYNTLMKSAQDI
ncbi:hypothetical protein PC121_g21982 [Phytophthora cactorum]|nr:hypothetical protein PC121_g21982 [Phytophthora cactorum]